MESKLTAYDFFDLVLAGEMGKLDIDNYIQVATDNYNIKKLKKLLEDIDYCFFCEREEKEAEYNEKDIADALKELEKNNREIPYKVIPDIKNKNGEILEKGIKTLDLEKIFFPFDFFGIYQLINQIKGLIIETEFNISKDIMELEISANQITIETVERVTIGITAKINGKSNVEKKEILLYFLKIFKQQITTPTLPTFIQNDIHSKPAPTQIIDWIELELKYIESIESIQLITTKKTETKTDKLKEEMGKYGFFELSKVKQLSEPNKQSLIELISTNDLPYSIAMFEYLGFLKHLKAEHYTTDYKLFIAVAKWFDVAERAVKGNIYVLNEHSKENRTRYTADQQKQTVQKDYENLK